VKLAADTAELKENMAKASEEVEGAVRKMEGAAKLLGLAFGARELVEGIKEFVVRSVEAFSEFEQTAMRLDVALRNTGQAVPELREAYHALASQLEDTTTQSDDALLSAEALFTTMGKVGPAEMQRALAAATDLAVFFNGDLHTAVETIIRASEGQTRGLKALGIEFDATAVAGNKMPAVLDAIHEKVGGQAQAQLETYAGKMAHLRNEWTELEKAFGKVIASGDSSVGFLSGWSTIISGISGSIDKFGLASTAATLFSGNLLGVVDAGTLVERQTQKAAEALAHMAPPATIDPLVAYRHHLDELHASITALTPAQQDLVRAGQAMGESTKDIADGLGLSERAVKAFVQAETEAEAAHKRFTQVAQEEQRMWEGFYKSSTKMLDDWVKGFNKDAKEMADVIAQQQIKLHELAADAQAANAALYSQGGGGGMDGAIAANEQARADKLNALHLSTLNLNDPNSQAQIEQTQQTINSTYDRMFNDIVAKAGEFGNDVAGTIAASEPKLAAASGQAAGSIQNNFLGIFGNVESRARTMVDSVTGALRSMQVDQMYRDAGINVDSTGPAYLMQQRQARGHTIAGMPHLASGGVVNGPTVALIGERGPEAVVPLDRAGAIGGSTTVHLTINVTGAKSAADEIIAAMKARGIRL
jgi:hypothetical protein